MRTISFLLASAALGAGAVGAALKLEPSAPTPSSHHDSDQRPGPDSGRVAILLDALGRTDPVICELIGDQIGNFWNSGERGGVGRLVATTPALQAAKDSIGGHVSDPRAIERLVSELGASSGCVRRVASKMLGNSEIASARLRALLGDPSPAVREAAAHAAGIGERRELRDALESALGDRTVAVAAMAAWALGEVEDRASIPALERAMRGSEPRVRLAAIWALGQLDDARVAPEVIPALRDVDATIRAMAAAVLGELESKEAIAPLERALARSNDAELREHAASSLAEIADPATTSALAGLLGDANRDIRRHAVEALGEIGTPAAVKTLTRALEDKDPEVRRAAVEALGERKDDN